MLGTLQYHADIQRRKGVCYASRFTEASCVNVKTDLRREAKRQRACMSIRKSEWYEGAKGTGTTWPGVIALRASRRTSARAKELIRVGGTYCCPLQPPFVGIFSPAVKSPSRMLHADALVADSGLIATHSYAGAGLHNYDQNDCALQRSI